MNFVLDACAMIAFLRGERGAEVVTDLLNDSAARCLAHAINVCEVYYDFIRAADERTATSAIRDLAKAGIYTRRDLGASFWKGVGLLKGNIRRVSLADCFAIQLSKRVGGSVVTSDHHEFDPLVGRRICDVTFIR